MSIHIKHPGRLHDKLGVAVGHKIPEEKIEAAAHSSSPALRKEAQFAINASHFHHGGANTQGTPHAHAVQQMIRQHGK